MIKNGKDAGKDEVTGEMIKGGNDWVVEWIFRRTSLLSIIGERYVGIQVDRVRKVRKGLIDDKQGGFIAEREHIDQSFTIKQKWEKAQE